MQACYADPTMRTTFSLALCFALVVPCVAQQTSTPPPGLPSDPHAILEAARPLYDFSASDLKPWHLKMNYQLYDEKENPTEQGTFEYWWASPQVHRTSWSHGSTSYTFWHLAGPGTAYLGSSETLTYAESKLEEALFSPLPTESTVDSDKTQLEKRTFGKAPNTFQCVMVGPRMKETSEAPISLFPTYCFASSQPALLAYFSYAQPTVEFDRITKVQNRYLPKQITILSSSHKKLLTAAFESVNGIAPNDPALTPPAEAKVSLHKEKSSTTTAQNSSGTANDDPAQLPEGILNGHILKKVPPIYPEDAKQARISGKVEIQAIIGRDGWIHDMQVLSAPSASLAASALGAVSQWHYKPYLLNGEPVEVETTINVIYALGN
jgi:TonB family protein